MVLTFGNFGKCIIDSFKVLKSWCWRSMDISWTNRVKNEVVHRVKEERDIVHKIK